MDIVTAAEVEDGVAAADEAVDDEQPVIAEPIVTELLVEEVSIDGMCGVY